MCRFATTLSRISFAALLIMLGICGCQVSYSYVLHGVVKNATDGSPVRGVRVTLKANRVTHQTGFPFDTSADRKFRAKFSISDQEFPLDGTLPKWSLVLSKGAFHDEEVDISPAQHPSGSQEVQIEV